MNTPTSEAAIQWATEWLDGVADGSNTMSQRKLTSIQSRGGDLEAVKALAEQKGVPVLLNHLLAGARTGTSYARDDHGMREQRWRAANG